ncbi:uncharacterized protein LOC129572699 isoform X2 [Sitodiplosis mosellana]|nr:uncharacterized protein LOC129572699 isoform X2 [Sitodiplosis mosellana]
MIKRMMWSCTFVLIAILLVQNAVGQSNYASHANNINYLGEGLPKEATLDGKITQLDDLSPLIVLNRTEAHLDCASGSMQVSFLMDLKGRCRRNVWLMQIWLSSLIGGMTM